MPTHTSDKKYVFWFKELGKEDIPIAGGKGANLGELAGAGFPVPNGFVISSHAYFLFIEENKLKSKIFQALKQVNINDPHSYTIVSREVKKLILEAKMPEVVAKEIMVNYLKMGSLFSKALVAVRSSATAEDLPTASFAGQQATYLNVQGEANVVKKVQECWASLFEARAIFYREENKFDHFKVGIAVPVQQMISSDISGVMFTIDPVSNEKNLVVIEAVWGLGEYIVQGVVSPDHYVVQKDSLDIVQKIISPQKVQLIKVGKETKETHVPLRLVNKRKVSDKQIIEIARIGKKIQNHYFFPQDIEWAIYKNKFYILQSRPITTIKEDNKQSDQEANLSKRKVLLAGVSASPGIAAGPVKKILNVRDIGKVEKGDVLVTTMTTPDFVPAMKKVCAIVTDKGGQTSHAAIVSRELGIPCVVGTTTATKLLKSNQIISVNGSKGEVYLGGLGINEKATPIIVEGVNMVPSIKNKVKTATKVYVNLAEPQLAETVAQRDCDGIGLLRAEFMIAEIGTHPKKLIQEKKQKIFIEKMTNDMEIFAKAFYPRPVVYRATDFKTNEYRNLKGGAAFEPFEENPLIGYRGCYRYITNPDVFELELKAIKNVREKYNNLWLMIPFVHTVEELAEVKKIIVANRLTRSASFKLWFMVEIPSNVIMLEEFLKVGVDGISIGSNDLTMLILGVDRDNQNLAKVYNERNPAVTWAIKHTIETCHKNGVTASLCGQAASSWGDLVQSMVSWGITSVSVNPDAIENTREIVYSAESHLLQHDSHHKISKS